MRLYQHQSASAHIPHNMRHICRNIQRICRIGIGIFHNYMSSPNWEINRVQAKCKNESCHQFHQETLLHGSPSSTETTQRPGPDGMYESTEQSGPGARLTRRSSQQFHRENPDFTAVPFSTSHSQSAVYDTKCTILKQSKG